jgi:hypothetical protein
MKLNLRSKPSRLGIKFQPGATYADLLDPIFKITDEEEAKEYFNDYVKFLMEDPEVSEQRAIEIAKINIGYWAGYYSTDVRMRVERLFETEHPYLGKAKEKQYTPDEILQMGIEAGKNSRPSS